MARRTSSVVETVLTLVYAVLIALGIRTIAFEPFNIPSGSMKPTLLVGDYLFVSKYSFGYSRHSLPYPLPWLAAPIFHGRLFGALPARGDVAVFKQPSDTSIDYIKRIVGLPGDRVQMKEGLLHINGSPVPRQDAGNYLDVDRGSRTLVKRYIETLPPAREGQPARVHDILKHSDHEWLDNTEEYRVPEGHVFAMGDNRDNSQDSRVASAVGFIPVENLVGRAEFIFFSIDTEVARWLEPWEWPFLIRWSRLIKGIT